jgi:acyl carrier protein
MTAAASDILETLNGLLREAANVDATLTPQTDLLADLQLDSIQQLALVVAIENHYQICFDPEDEAQVSSVQSVIALVQRHLADKQAA